MSQNATYGIGTIYHRINLQKVPVVKIHKDRNWELVKKQYKQGIDRIVKSFSLQRNKNLNTYWCWEIYAKNELKNHRMHELFYIKWNGSKMKKTKTGQGNKRKSKNAQKVTGNFDQKSQLLCARCCSIVNTTKGTTKKQKWTVSK